MTLENANGVSITSLTEGQSGTLKLTLDPSEVVYTIPITIHISLNVGDLSTTEIGEVLIGTGDRFRFLECCIQRRTGSRQQGRHLDPDGRCGRGNA